MRVIELHHVHDFKKLEGLKGTDFITVKIDSKLARQKITIDAIDLSLFHGTISFSVDETIQYVLWTVRVSDKATKKNIFSSISKCNIYTPRVEFRITYQNNLKQFHVKKEEDLFTLKPLLKNYENIEIILDNDIVCPKFKGFNLSNFKGNFRVVGNHHTVYRLLDKDKKPIKIGYDYAKGIYKEVEISYDTLDGKEVMYIYTIEDLRKLSHLKSGKKYYIFLMNSFEDVELDSIDLQNFQGSLEINGLNHQFSNTKLEKTEGPTGLISSIGFSSDLVIKNVHINQIYAQSTGPIGTFLGYRRNPTGPYHSCEGKILFDNCSVRHSDFYTDDNSGILVGIGDPFMSYQNCRIEGNKFLGKETNQTFGRQNVFCFDYRDYQKMERASKLDSVKIQTMYRIKKQEL